MAHGGCSMAKQTLVLLVPGDRLTGVLTESGLQGFGYDVLVAGSPEEASDLLRTDNRIDVVVVDADLPQGLRSPRRRVRSIRSTK